MYALCSLQIILVGRHKAYLHWQTLKGAESVACFISIGIKKKTSESGTNLAYIFLCIQPKLSLEMVPTKGWMTLVRRGRSGDQYWGQEQTSDMAFVMALMERQKGPNEHVTSETKEIPHLILYKIQGLQKRTTNCHWTVGNTKKKSSNCKELYTV